MEWLEGKLMEFVDGARNFEQWGGRRGYEIRQAIRRPRAIKRKKRIPGRAFRRIFCSERDR
jgi:hypothetical protein